MKNRKKETNLHSDQKSNTKQHLKGSSYLKENFLEETITCIPWAKSTVPELSEDDLVIWQVLPVKLLGWRKTSGENFSRWTDLDFSKYTISSSSVPINLNQ